MSSANEIRSPAVGTILEILVTAGDSVVADQELLIIESMKVEIPVLAPQAGTVEKVMIELEAQVAENDVLLTLR